MGLVYLTLGVALWSAAHLFKRLAPGPRARLGDGARGLVALLLIVAIVLMSIGYRQADYTWLWFPQPWMIHLNNLAVLIGFYIFGIGMARGVLSQKVRHPMLIGTLVWALAHLLVRGHVAGVILFGGLALWAVLAMVLINTQQRVWEPAPAKGSYRRDLVALPIVLVTFLIVGFVHRWLGVNPFGGGVG